MLFKLYAVHVFLTFSNSRHEWQLVTMNAIISLCHFCELHGPSILFCTQAFHSHEPQQVLGGEASLDNSGNCYSSWNQDRDVRSPTLGASASTPTPAPSFSKVSSDLCEVCLISWIHSKCLLYNYLYFWFLKKIHYMMNIVTLTLLQACRSFPAGQPGFISNDHESKVSYISSQHPHHPLVFSMVRQACVRSLSCEVL